MKAANKQIMLKQQRGSDVGKCRNQIGKLNRFRNNNQGVSTLRQQQGISQIRTRYSNRKDHPLRIIKKPKKYMYTSSEPENANRYKENRSHDIEDAISMIKENMNASNEKNTSVNNETQVSIAREPLVPLPLAPSSTLSTFVPSPSMTPSTSVSPTLLTTVPLTLGPLPPSSPSPALLANFDEVNVRKHDSFTTLSSHLPAHSKSFTNTHITGSTFHLVDSNSPYHSSDELSMEFNYNQNPFPNTWHHKDQQYNVQTKHQSSYVSNDNIATEIQREVCRTNIPQTSSSKCTAQNDNIRFSFIQKKIDTLITTQENVQKLCENLPTKQDIQNLNRKLDRLFRKRTNMPKKPDFLPLKSIEEMEAFENITDESYEAVVEYLQFLGGRNIHESVIFCLREAVSDTVICNYSVWGERGNRSLFNTRLIKAIYDAVASNFQPPPHRDEFFKQVSEGVRFGKQRIRNIIVGKKHMAETEARQRKHDEARNLLDQRENLRNPSFSHATEEEDYQD